MTPTVTLRPVTPRDLPTLFEHQLDPEATAMAAFPSRDRAAFFAHWERILADPTVRSRAIVADGALAGSIAAFDQGGRRLVGYWLGREHWGRGIATRALASFVVEERARALAAFVAAANVRSIRVLERCGFRRVAGPTPGPDGVEELLFELG